MPRRSDHTAFSEKPRETIRCFNPYHMAIASATAALRVLAISVPPEVPAPVRKRLDAVLTECISEIEAAQTLASFYTPR